MAPSAARPRAAKTKSKRAAGQPARLNDNQYTPAEDSLLRELKEVEKKDWNQIHTIFNERFPDPGRTRGSLQVRYSRSVQSARNLTALAESSAIPTVRPPALALEGEECLANEVPTASADAIDESGSSKACTTRSGRLVKGTAKIAGIRVSGAFRASRAGVRKKPSVTTKGTKNNNDDDPKASITKTNQPQKKSSKPHKAADDWDEADQKLWDEAMADVPIVPGWDFRTQGQPPMLGLKPRVFAGPKSKPMGHKSAAPKKKFTGRIPTAARSRPPGRVLRSNIHGSATTLDTDSHDFGEVTRLTSLKRVHDEMNDDERFAVEAKRPRLEPLASDDEKWTVIHPVVLPRITQRKELIPWAQRFPGPYHVVEQHHLHEYQVRLRKRRPGEVQPLPPLSDVGTWEFVGADTDKLGLHDFENCQYGSNWVLRANADDGSVST